MEYPFVLKSKVRDYECDIQGVVNNAVYQNYLEHARHEYLLELGVDFSALAEAGINLVVIRAEVDYKQALRPGDRYWIGVRLERVSKIRFAFIQDIYKEGDAKPCINARIIGTSLNQRGRPCSIGELDMVLAD